MPAEIERLLELGRAGGWVTAVAENRLSVSTIRQKPCGQKLTAIGLASEPSVRKEMVMAGQSAISRTSRRDCSAISRRWLRDQTHGVRLSDEQLRATPSASKLSVGGLIKHSASTEEGWLATIRREPQSIDYQAYAQNFS